MGERMNKCNHEDGWIIKEGLVISPNGDNDFLAIECQCNNISCTKTKKFNLSIENIEEVKVKKQ